MPNESKSLGAACWTNQDQFDALLSFAYNLGESGSRDKFGAANSGSNALIANNMALWIDMHPCDTQKHRLPPHCATGLVNRCRKEAPPFTQEAR